MPVEIRHFLETKLVPKDGGGEDLVPGTAAELQEYLRLLVKDAVLRHKKKTLAFGSIKQARDELFSQGFFSLPVINDLELRREVSSQGQFPGDFAVLFFKIYSLDIPDLLLGSLMIGYTSELELETGDLFF